MYTGIALVTGNDDRMQLLMRVRCAPMSALPSLREFASFSYTWTETPFYSVMKTCRMSPRGVLSCRSARDNRKLSPSPAPYAA